VDGVFVPIGILPKRRVERRFYPYHLEHLGVFIIYDESLHGEMLSWTMRDAIKPPST
jgi:hypothetical protein